MKNSLSSIYKKHKRKFTTYIKTKEKHSLDLSIMNITETDKNKVWAFCAGQHSNDFRGNPKFLFIYINKYRKDITAYWLCDNDDIVSYVRKLGFRAYRIGTKQAEEAINRTGVLVHEQVREKIPEGLENVKYINLWHGVGGVKNVERSIETGRLVEAMAKKYIKNNALFRKNELYLAPSKFIEDIAIDQLGLSKDNIIRAGYPRCIYTNKYSEFSSFNHDLINSRGLPEDTKIITYTPTYRNEQSGDFFTKAIPNLEKLLEVCEKNHYLFIFKMHPLLEQEVGFLKSKEKYENCKWFIFWDNFYDFYEVMNQIDLCIYDFSSIYTDFVAFGTKNYIRYLFDNDELTFDFPMDYDSTTLGKKCLSFDELIEYLDDYKQDLSKEIKKVKDLYWEYSTDNDMDNIVDSILNFKSLDLDIKNLYSYDIFDTLISRKVLDPIGIHYYVKEKINNPEYGFSKYFINNYPELRRGAELNMREYYNRTKIDRDSLKVEIQFEEIFDRLKKVYSLTDKQKDILMKYEMEAELENVIPLNDKIDEVKQLVSNGEKVILISDMYLPKDFIKKMLVKADPILGDLDLYLSSDYGYQKADKTLFIEVYKVYGRKYNFKKWVHTGDNIVSDGRMPKKLFIESNRITPLVFNNYERDIVNTIQTYDSYLVAASLARFRQNHQTIREQFIYSYISFLFVPYVYWALHNAKKDGDKSVYFVSRDGHQLKRIGDVINEEEKLKLKLKYIYASRKTWRIPSFIDHIDIDFWGMGHGNFVDIKSFKNLLKALNVDEETFDKFFPELESYKTLKTYTPKDLRDMVQVFSSSSVYEEYLLNKAKEERVSVSGYLKQEIDEDEQFSIVEYWGRGYTQENFTRLWDDIVKKDVPSKFYYSRSTLPSDELNIRYNYVVNPEQQQFIESIFACIDYKTITKYEKKDDKWAPVINKQKCDYSLFRGMEKYLPEFAKEYCNINFLDVDCIGRDLINFAISYYTSNPTWVGFVDVLGELEDSVQLYGDEDQFAKPLTLIDINMLRFNKVKLPMLTKNPSISLARSSDRVKNEFKKLYQMKKLDNIDIKDIKKYKRFEIRKNERAKEIYDEYRDRASIFAKEYNRAVVKNNVSDKILILSKGNDFKDINYKFLEMLDNQEEYSVVYMNINDNNLAYELATSKYILLDKPIYLLNEIKVRRETKIILVSNHAMFYFTRGLLDNSNLSNVSALEKYIFQTEFSTIPVASSELIKTFDKIYTTSVDTDFLPFGPVVTDLYFDKEYKKKIKNKIRKLCPAAKNKKIISYIIFDRYRNKDSSYTQMLNMNSLYNSLHKDYVILQIHIKNDSVDYISNSFKYKNFAFDLTNKISIRDLMIGSDIIIGDYDDYILEAPLVGVPVFISVYDTDTVESDFVTLTKISKEPYGKIVNTTDEFIESVLDIDNFDYTNQNEFKNKYFVNCNGDSSEKLYDYILKKKK